MNGLKADLKTIVMTKEPKNIEEFRHAANLAEKAIDSNVNSVNSMNQTVLDEIHSLREHIQSINVNSTTPVTNQEQSYQPSEQPIYVQQPVYYTPRAPNHDMYSSNRHTKLHSLTNKCSGRGNSNQKSKQFVTDMHQCLIPVYFGGIKIKALLDTGSTISAINEKTFFKTKFANNRLLRSDIKQIVGAGGATYPVKGQIKLNFEINGVVLSQKFYIIPALRHSMILGTDFCKEKSVCLNWNTNKLSLIKNSVTINVIRVTPGFARVYRKSLIPPNTMMNVCVRLSHALPQRNYLLEPLKNLKYNFLTAKCLIRNRNNKCYLQILNPTNEVITLRSGLILATMNDVDTGNIFTLDNDKTVKSMNLEQTNSDQKDIQFDLSKADLTDQQKQKLNLFLNQNRNVFATNLKELGKTDVYKHKINTGNAPPVKSRPYRTSPAAKQEIQKQVEELLKYDIIEPSKSEYSSPIVLVKKKDNTWRLCIDFRSLNKQSILQQHPLPRLDDVFDAIGQSNAKIYSRLDLTMAYYQMPMDEHSKHKTAFITHDNLYQFKRMPYGLNNACQSFQSLMTQVLRGLTWKHCLVYVDDVIIWSEDFDSHLQHLDLIFQRLKQANLKLRPNKCDFAKSEILYLGHIISKEGIKVDTSKTKAVETFPIPNNQHDVRSFLGLCNYYRKFVKSYAKIASPLNRLLTKDTPFKWTTDCQNAFETLKEALTSTPVLNFPNFNKPFIVSCDASGSAIGYILSQIGDDEKEHVIGYGGRALTPTEKNYTVTEQEMLALVSAVAYFHVYLATNKFTIYTDHKALTWLQTIKHTNSRLIRWALKLQEYNFDVIHRMGSRNQHCDALSRRNYEKQTDQPKVLTEVTFIYPGETLEKISNSEKDIPIFSLEDISSLQKQCPYFGPIITFLENGILPDDKKRAQAIPYETGQYELLNDTLYHFFQPRTKTRTSKNQLIKQVAIPEPLRNDILLSFHDQKAGGSHLGVQRTYEAIKQRYFWPKMYQNVYDYVTSCQICQTVKKDSTAKKAPLKSLPVQGPFVRLHMDVLGGLPTSKEKYKYILLVTDSFSHWCECFPMKTQEAEEIANILYSEIFTRYGACRYLVSDRHASNLGKLVNLLCKMFNVTQHFTSSYHPQSNVACERTNSTLAQSLRAYCSEQQTNWPQVLPSIMMAFRMSPCTQSTGFSPYYMIFGREMPLPIDIALIPEELITQSPEKYIDQLINKVKIIHDLAKTNLEDAQLKSKTYYDKSTKIPNFKVGDHVLLKQEKVQIGKKKKLEPKWTGPFSILENRHDLIYKLLNLKTLRPVKSFIHANRLKAFKDPSDFRPPPNLLTDKEALPNEPANINQPNPDNLNEDLNQAENKEDNSQSDVDESTSNNGQNKNDQWYEAIKLLKLKWISGKKHYLVQWKDNSNPTWEPQENVSQALKVAFHSEKAHKRLKKKTLINT
ncbi:unnamed protein product [Mytilus edulis]|uniref:RNA-directed DNA polymerase n=1 Tax=Mytilus edulis TaxID=6550 RepID=A0A8S3QSS7_MYTED|nr:unnamed protein product [Mytilus edulis]